MAGVVPRCTYVRAGEVDIDDLQVVVNDLHHYYSLGNTRLWLEHSVTHTTSTSTSIANTGVGVPTVARYYQEFPE